MRARRPKQTISRLRRSTLAAATQEKGSKVLLSPPFQAVVAAKCYIYMLTLFLQVLPGPVNQSFFI